MNKPVPVLDKGSVLLEEMMGNEAVILSSARTSHMSTAKDEADDERLLKQLYNWGHHVPFEMVVFRFRFVAPELVFRQWVRHRIGSFVVQSRRYTQATRDNFHYPDAWRLQQPIVKTNGGTKEFVDTVNQQVSKELNSRLCNIYDLCADAYERAIDLGVSIEQARLFLPGYSVYSEVVWKANLRSLLNFLSLRTSSHAQWEIRCYANTVLSIVRPLIPNVIALWMQQFY